MAVTRSHEINRRQLLTWAAISGAVLSGVALARAVNIDRIEFSSEPIATNFDLPRQLMPQQLEFPLPSQLFVGNEGMPEYIQDTARMIDINPARLMEVKPILNIPPELVPKFYTEGPEVLPLRTLKDLTFLAVNGAFAFGEDIAEAIVNTYKASIPAVKKTQNGVDYLAPNFPQLVEGLGQRAEEISPDGKTYFVRYKADPERPVANWRAVDTEILGVYVDAVDTQVEALARFYAEAGVPKPDWIIPIGSVPTGNVAGRPIFSDSDFAAIWKDKDSFVAGVKSLNALSTNKSNKFRDLIREMYEPHLRSIDGFKIPSGNHNALVYQADKIVNLYKWLTLGQ